LPLSQYCSGYAILEDLLYSEQKSGKIHPRFTGSKIENGSPMQREELRQDIADLTDWIETRAKLLDREMAERAGRLRTLIRAGNSRAEVESENRKLADLKKEEDALNESRQILELKRALLNKLETVINFSNRGDL
jgi:hypothetical protein